MQERRAAYHHWRSQAQERSANREHGMDRHISRGQAQSLDYGVDL